MVLFSKVLTLCSKDILNCKTKKVTHLQKTYKSTKYPIIISVKHSWNKKNYYLYISMSYTVILS